MVGARDVVYRLIRELLVSNLQPFAVTAQEPDTKALQELWETFMNNLSSGENVLLVRGASNNKIII